MIMKRSILIVPVILTVIVLSYFYFINQNSAPSNIVTTSVTQTPSPTTATETPGVTFEPRQTEGRKSYWVIVRDTDKIELYSNLEAKLTSSEALKEYSCLHLTTGGFYNTENEHIGLFANHEGILSSATDNATYNGFFSISEGKEAKITSFVPQNFRLAIQTGPVLMTNGRENNLTIKNDEGARRVVLATTQTGNVVFITFYDGKNPLFGPKLSELPAVLTELENNSSLDIENAINLDGGSHSAFLSETVNLKEISRSGSFFCIKP